jgi:hypothetical protein
MATYDLEDELECDECGETYLVAYHETSPDAMFCPFCGFEAETCDDEDAEDGDDFNRDQADLLNGE